MVYFSPDNGGCWHKVQLPEAISIDNIRVDPKGAGSLFIVHGQVGGPQGLLVQLLFWQGLSCVVARQGVRQLPAPPPVLVTLLTLEPSHTAGLPQEQHQAQVRVRGRRRAPRQAAGARRQGPDGRRLAGERWWLGLHRFTRCTLGAPVSVLCSLRMPWSSAPPADPPCPPTRPACVVQTLLPLQDCSGDAGSADYESWAAPAANRCLLGSKYSMQVPGGWEHLCLLSDCFSWMLG